MSITKAIVQGYGYAVVPVKPDESGKLVVCKPRDKDLYALLTVDAAKTHGLIDE